MMNSWHALGSLNKRCFRGATSRTRRQRATLKPSLRYGAAIAAQTIAALFAFGSPSAEELSYRAGEVLVHFSPAVIDLPVDPHRRTIPYEEVPIPDELVRMALNDIGTYEFRLVAPEWREVESAPPEEDGYVPLRFASFRDWYLVRFSMATPVESAIARLNQEPHAILSVEPNWVGESQSYWPPDPGLCTSPCNEPYQWNLNNVAGTINCIPCSTGFDIGMVEAWDIQPDCKVKVADLDTGADSDHPDLSANLDAFLAWDFDGDDSDWEDISDDGHGTATAGIIGAVHNTLGIAGICGNPDPNTSLEVVVPLKVFPDPPSVGAESAVVNDAIAYCSGLYPTIPIVLIEVGYTGQALPQGERPAMRDAMFNAFLTGLTLVTTAGNTGGNSAERHFPAWFKHTNLSVTAVGCDASRDSDFKDGSWIDVAAPSTADDGTESPGIPQIMTTARGGGYTGQGTGCNRDYFGGTSAAAPHAAGAAAMLLSHSPEMTNEDITELVRRTAHPLGDPEEFGKGLLRLDGGLRLLDERELVHDSTTVITSWEQLNPTCRQQKFRNIQVVAAVPGTPNFMGETYVPVRVNVYEFRTTVTLAQHEDSTAQLHAWVRGLQSVAARDTVEYDGYFEPYVGEVDSLDWNVISHRGYTYEILNETCTTTLGWYPLKLPLAQNSNFTVFSYTYLGAPDTGSRPQPGARRLEVASSIVQIGPDGGVVEFRSSSTSPGRLLIFDVTGRELMRVDEASERNAWRTIPWTGRGGSGQNVPRGLYFGKLEVGDDSAQIRFLVVH